VINILLGGLKMDHENGVVQHMIDNIKLLRNNKGDFEYFKTLLKSEVINLCNTRWLISICDTYADHGTNLEQSTACIIIGIYNLIRIEYTVKLCTSRRLLKNPSILSKSHDCYDGMHCIQNVKWEDTLRNYSKRLRKVLERTPTLEYIFKKLDDRNHAFNNLLTSFRQMTNMEVFIL
jgi:hypothetical protein